MNKVIPALGLGVLLGIIATLAFNQVNTPLASRSGEVVRDVVDIQPMTDAVAERHRGEHYAGLTTIEDILALPTEFSRSEALHLLAGRSDFTALGNLVADANRIADEVKREALLTVLFARLTELDPQASLELARSDELAELISLEETVWRVWGRNDLDDALFGARTQTRLSHQRQAARSLYREYGYLGNETTDRIEAELGIKPDWPTRMRFIYRLADRSPSEAIEYINGLEGERERKDAASSLAHYLSQGDPSDALQYANLFAHRADSALFSTIVKGEVLLTAPEAAIAEMLEGSADAMLLGQYEKAVLELASTNLDAVKRYYEQARSEYHRQLLGSAIVAELAKNEPAEALAWARAHDKGNMPVLELHAIEQIAQTNPQLAMSETLASPNSRTRSTMVGLVMRQVVATDPIAAVAFLDQIEDREQRADASEALTQVWIRTDTDAAVEWILSQDEELAEQLMARAVSDLAFSDVDTAIRLLPKLNDEKQLQARQRIAEMLTEIRSVDDAQAFVMRFQGQPGYDQLQAAVISRVARRDAMTARQFANQIQDPAARDSAHLRIVTERADVDPVEALGWLDGISDTKMRSQATAQVAFRWYMQDPVAATQWLSNMPRGSNRDAAISQLAGAWGNPTPQQAALIESIGDQQKRGEAKFRQIIAVTRSDPDRARAMLEDDDITEKQRAEIEEIIERNDSGF